MEFEKDSSRLRKACVLSSAVMSMYFLNLCFGYGATRSGLLSEEPNKGRDIGRTVNEYSSLPFSYKVFLSGNYIAARQHLSSESSSH